MEKEIKDGRIRSNIQIGSEVEVVQKQDQRSGDLTQGIVKRILTKSPNHHRGIKVMLESGEVGRVQSVFE
ncbi:MAG TPA: YwbE family protein [Bacteroidales bacterium]|nr:YwbE family protein [Bacteroidales bacterium]